MTYEGLVKSLRLPPGCTPPTVLEYDGIRATVLGRADRDDDVRGINASLELIQRTRGGGWPTEPVTEDVDFGALREWATEAYPFTSPYFSNREVPQT